MRIIDGWVRRLHVVAVDNAREAATETSRRLVEAAEVEAFLSRRRWIGRVADPGSPGDSLLG